jgi:hypothetical protein
MRRREFIAASLGAMAVGYPSRGNAQQSNRLRRIGTLLTGIDPQFSKAFIQGPEKSGWIEGLNIHIEERFHLGLGALPEAVGPPAPSCASRGSNRGF